MKRLNIELTDDQVKHFQAAAKRRELSFEEWVITTLNEATGYIDPDRGLAGPAQLSPKTCVMVMKKTPEQ